MDENLPIIYFFDVSSILYCVIFLKDYCLIIEMRSMCPWRAMIAEA
jgi:hypothetical protein